MVLDASDGVSPLFCISKKRNCRGEGLVLNTLLFAEFGADGQEVEQVWAIKPIANVPLRELRYGIVPEGWRELGRPRPLR